MRLVIVAFIFLLSLCIPNLNILLTLSGSLLGTLVNVWFPVLFYLRAYNGSDKNKNLEVNDKDEPAHKPRTWIKIGAYVMLVVGTIIGIWGLGYVIYELYEGVEGDEV